MPQYLQAGLWGLLGGSALRLQHAYDHCLGCLPTEPSSSIAFTLEDGDD